MNDNPVLYLMTGVLFGTTLLAIGIAIGFWIGSKTKTSGVEPATQGATTDAQHFLQLVRSFATWTNEVATEVSQYQSRLHSLAEQAHEKTQAGDASGLRPILDEIVSVNAQLQCRLEVAEQKLEHQTRQLEEYLTEARTDGLTGLANRRAFDQKLNELFAQSQRTGQHLCLALIDIDHFKKINDTYGHAAGDVVLKKIASILFEHTDECLQVARYGGEEFALLFAQDKQSVAAVMERIRLQVAAKPITGEGHSIPVTLSCGIAQWSREARIGDLFRATDTALYSAKHQGRNRTVVHDPAANVSFNQSNSATSTVAHGAHPQRTIPTLANLGSETMAGSSDTELPPIDDLERRVLAHLDRLVLEESTRDA